MAISLKNLLLIAEETGANPDGSNFDQRSLGYGDNKPLITKDLPAVEKQTNGALGLVGEITDNFVRGGAIHLVESAATDVVRLGKLFLTPNGIAWAGAQLALSRTNPTFYVNDLPLTRGANNRLTSPAHVLGTAGTGAAGIRFRRDRALDLKTESGYNYDPQRGGPKYESNFFLAINQGINEVSDNALFGLYNKISGGDLGIIKEYPGGPHSTFGIGNTTIKQYKSNPFNDIGKNGGYLPLFNQEFFTLRNPGLPSTINNDYRTLGGEIDNKPIGPPISSEKTKINLYNLGDPGLEPTGEGESYNIYDVRTIDKISAANIFKRTDLEDFSGTFKDYIKFRIAVVDTDNPLNDNIILFRALLDSINDTYSGEWNPYKYNGRAENFYTYSGFDRKISFSFKIHTQTRWEQKPLWRKLNYLVAQTAPEYRNRRMRGVFSRLTIGDWMNEIPGFFTNITLGWTTAYPWEIRHDANGADRDLNEYPHILDVNCEFQPVHDFTPSNSPHTPFIIPNKGVNNSQDFTKGSNDEFVDDKNNYLLGADANDAKPF